MKQIFRCEFCLTQGIESDIAKHENNCEYNPANKKCGSCKNFDGQYFCLILKSPHNVVTPRNYCNSWEPKK